jgi:hypothetical protein
MMVSVAMAEKMHQWAGEQQQIGHCRQYVAGMRPQ